jgi:hypothetical protein
MYTENNSYHTLPKFKKRRITKRFVVKTLHYKQVVIDRTTGLMWQQSASPRQMIYRLATDWINSLNERGFAGFNDWRLPTLEEAMTLIEQFPNTDGLFIAPVFDSKKRLWMWTSERGGADSVWYVNFNYGYSKLNRIKSGNNYVRAVRMRS